MRDEKRKIGEEIQRTRKKKEAVLNRICDLQTQRLMFEFHLRDHAHAAFAAEADRWTSETDVSVLLSQWLQMLEDLNAIWSPGPSRSNGANQAVR
jgi:hypothetical protein